VTEGGKRKRMEVVSKSRKEKKGGGKGGKSVQRSMKGRQLLLADDVATPSTCFSRTLAAFPFAPTLPPLIVLRSFLVRSRARNLVRQRDMEVDVRVVSLELLRQRRRVGNLGSLGGGRGRVRLGGTSGRSLREREGQ
jgi:hypothetical protein